MANIQSPEFWVLVLPIRDWSEPSLGAHATFWFCHEAAQMSWINIFLFISKSTVRWMVVCIRFLPVLWNMMRNIE